MSFQKATIEKEVTIEGIGLHTGQPVRMICRPATPGVGITFIRTDLSGQPQIQSSADAYDSGSGRRSVIGNDVVKVDTTEHFFAALWGLGISDIFVEINNAEMPALDGSSASFVTHLKDAGLKLLGVEAAAVEIKEPIFVSKTNAAILAMPAKEFKITYALDYKQSAIDKMVYDHVITQDYFLKEIAPARTFCTKSEADALLSAGYGKGANTENTLVMDESGPIDNRLVWKDECARHKVLDLIGDVSVLGLNIKAHLIAIRSGHDLNHQLTKTIAHQTGSFV